MSDPSSTVFSASELDLTWANDPLNYTIKCFAAFLQTIWETAPRGCFHWTPSSEETELVITEDNPVYVDAVEKKPAISLVLGPTRFSGTALDELMTVKPVDGSSSHTDLIPGTMTLNCMARAIQECRFIAWQSARTIWNLRKLFLKELCFHEVGRNIQIGAVSPAGALVAGDTEGEWHAVAVQVPFFLQWSDTVTPLKMDWSGTIIQRLREIGITLRTKVQAPNTEDAEIRRIVTQKPWLQGLKPPSIRGRAIQVEPTPPLVQKSKV